MTVIDGCRVRCYSPGGTLWVQPPSGPTISVLTRGTHVALDVLGKDTKRKIVRWWKAQRS